MLKDIQRVFLKDIFKNTDQTEEELVTVISPDQVGLNSGMQGQLIIRKLINLIYYNIKWENYVIVYIQKAFTKNKNQFLSNKLLVKL